MTIDRPTAIRLPGTVWHLLVDVRPSYLPLGPSEVVAACGWWTASDPEDVPASQTSPADRCRICWPEPTTKGDA